MKAPGTPLGSRIELSRLTVRLAQLNAVASSQRKAGLCCLKASPQEAAAILDQVCAVVNSQWRRCYRQAGVSEQDCERLAGAFVYEGLLK